ncbi:MAG: DUF4386 family protein [Bacteroidales bacterium]|nr:DUF4386 family protein [Bacteroidales bacterium]
MKNSKFAFYSSALLALITIVTFGTVKPPITGPFCPGNCIDYPFTEIAAQFPKDYIWMYLSVVMMLLYVTVITCIHYYSSEEKKIFSHTGLVFSIITATVLIIDYFVQVSVIQPSILKGETEGIALLTQYNPHGIFIALEDLGYMLMGISFLFIGLVFIKSKGLGKTIGIIFITGSVLAIGSFIVISLVYGIHREYIYECIVIVVDWLVLIVNGILLSILFRRANLKQ